MIDASSRWPSNPVLVVMGVSGSGKSTVAGILAGRLGWDFLEGDDLHPQANVDKMAAGQPLTDDDRMPWLALVETWITARTSRGQPAIVTCSALKRSYRDVLRGENVVFVYLAGPPELIARRLSARVDHYMPPSLLASQLATLEPPAPDEQVIAVDVGRPPEVQAEEVIRALGLGD